MKYCTLSAEDAVARIKSGDRVFLHTAAATPQRLIDAMVNRSAELKNVEIISLHTEGEAAYARPEYRESFRLNALFVGKNVRQSVQNGDGDPFQFFSAMFPPSSPIRYFRSTLPLFMFLLQTDTATVLLEFLSMQLLQQCTQQSLLLPR